MSILTFLCVCRFFFSQEMVSEKESSVRSLLAWRSVLLSVIEILFSFSSFTNVVIFPFASSPSNCLLLYCTTTLSFTFALSPFFHFHSLSILTSIYLTYLAFCHHFSFFLSSSYLVSPHLFSWSFFHSFFPSLY